MERCGARGQSQYPTAVLRYITVHLPVDLVGNPADQGEEGEEEGTSSHPHITESTCPARMRIWHRQYRMSCLYNSLWEGFAIVSMGKLCRCTSYTDRMAASLLQLS